VDKEAPGLRPGDFIVSEGSKEDLHEIAEKTGVDFKALQSEVVAGTPEVKKPRIGIYQRYYGGNMDEGWTRLVLEMFSFPYASLMDAEIKKGNLRARYDVIILPDDSPGMIMGEIPERYRRFISAVPPEYRSGIGQEGVDALKDFVEKGGILITLGQASGFAIDKFSLRVRNVVADLPSREFFCPGSTVKVRFDNTHSLAYGMPAEGLILFNSNQAFEIQPGQNNEMYETVVRYRERDLLQSGWLIGEKHLSGKPAAIRVEVGKGEVILFGFRPQHRAQTHGTFKLFFNALLR
ncbi:MAG: peptidase M14 family protein, partial [Candidatus Aminicenantes bacterium]|nr:peptidase M14 family protein [Candidatus Aminicenantes bacterium]